MLCQCLGLITNYPLLGILELGDLVDEVLLGVGAARHARPHLVHLLGDLAVLLLGRLPLPDNIN